MKPLGQTSDAAKSQSTKVPWERPQVKLLGRVTDIVKFGGSLGPSKTVVTPR